jgi:DeoR/GlpR family transcriptional regulator of sugar metabolism
MSVLNYPLTNVQIELMKLFNTNLSENELAELKNLLSKFYADKAISQADAIWDEKGLTDDDMEKWLNEKS